MRFVNFDAARAWYPAPTAAPAKARTAVADYVIITTRDIVAGSEQAIDDFVFHKRIFGHTVRVVTEDDYGGLAAPRPNQRADKVRQWLVDHYIPLGIRWVLLIGNPDPDSQAQVGHLPMKMTWPEPRDPPVPTAG